MHIVYLNPSGQVGGAESCLLDAIAVLRQVRPEWSLTVILSEEGPLTAKIEALGGRVHVLAFPSDIARLGDSGVEVRWSVAVRLIAAVPASIRYRSQLRHLLEGLTPDLIHTNGFKMHVFGALAKPKGTRLVWHIHDYISSRPVMARLMRWLAPRTDLIITNSESVATDTRQSLGNHLNIVPILNVVDLSEFTPHGSTLDLDTLSGFPAAPQGVVRVGLLATLAWWKGHRLFLDALSRLDRQIPVRAYYIGGALYKTQAQQSLEDLRQYANDLGLENRVGFTGVVSDPAFAMRSLDVIVHCSTEPEPFGRVIVEAMGCARPVITTNLGGAAEITALGDFALTIDRMDPATLTTAITKLTTNPELRARLGSNGLSTARANFGRERLARQLPAVYEEVLSRNHGPKFTRAHA
jgi:glycosyltransferase involved in cell wall biosynthesis